MAFIRRVALYYGVPFVAMFVVLVVFAVKWSYTWPTVQLTKIWFEPDTVISGGKVALRKEGIWYKLCPTIAEQVFLDEFGWPTRTHRDVDVPAQEGPIVNEEVKSGGVRRFQ